MLNSLFVRMGAVQLLLLGALLAPARTAVSGTQTISAIDAKRDGEVTTIELEGARDPIYSAYLRPDPDRIIVELPGTTVSGVKGPIDVNDGLVDSITIGGGDSRMPDDIARITITLTQASEYQVVPSDRGLRIEIRQSSPAERTTVARNTGPDSGSLPVQTESAAAPESSTAGRGQDEPPRRMRMAGKGQGSSGKARILRVEPSDQSVKVVMKGLPSEVESFALSNPTRLVVDLFGAERGTAPTRKTGSGAIKQVRLGAHTDKVRVVLDLRDVLTAHEVVAADDGVEVLINGKARQAGTGDQAGASTAGASDAEAGTPFGAPPGSDTSGPLVVEGAHFESLPTKDRVVITMSRPAATQVVEPDPDTLIVRIPQGSIAANNERRVDTREFGGPVEVFSVFQTPEVKEPEVRLVVKRREPVKARLVWAGEQLYVELDRTMTMGPMPADYPAQGDTGAVPDGGSQSQVGPDGAPANAADTPAGVPSFAAAPPDSPVPTANGPSVVSPDGLEDPFMFEGPGEPAAIDVLQEGGFSEEKKYTGRRISLDFKDADIANILRLIAEVSDLNVIAGEEVTGTVTIRLVDIPWDQALDVILLTKGLGFVRVGNVLRIAPLETIKLEAEQRLQERRAKEKLEDLVVKLQPVNFANVEEVSKLVKRLLTKRGSVDVDKRTNTLIIKDISAVVQEATALVKAIDTQTPQVLIEAKIVEATLSFSRSLGAVWGLGYEPIGNDRTQVEDDDFKFAETPSFFDNALGLANNFVTQTPANAAATGLLSLGVLSLDDQLQLDLQIQAAEDNRKGKVISSPRVVTIDNREATIKQGVAIAFTEATSDRITTSFIDAVLELTVTPHITANRSVIMDIKVSRNAPQLSASNGTVTGIAKNETKTEALVRDGETIVLGGIYVVDSGRQSQKVPFLADIPILGVAFRNKSVADERRELLIFVTPRVILGRPSDT